MISEVVGHLGIRALIRERMKRVSLSVSLPKTLGMAFCPGL